MVRVGGQDDWQIYLDSIDQIAFGVLGLGFAGYQASIGANQNVRVERQPQVQKLVLVDDFAPQPLIGEALWYYNRLGGDCGQSA